MADDFKDMRHMVKSASKSYDTWRLRGLTEEKAHTASEQLVEHTEALKIVEKKLAKGDAPGAIKVLQQIKSKIDETIKSLK